jgi:site-specific DNA recombinase
VQLAGVAEPVLRRLFEAFRLQVRYDRPANLATCQVTLREDRIPGLLAALEPVTEGAAGEPSITADQGSCSHLLRALGRIRTCAPASGGRCSIP